MRIISGKYKGKRISPPKGFNSRPTTDYAKESLFNILVNRFDLKTLKVLDLFSGSGNISFEFLSRGCEDLISVEISKKFSNHIKEQIVELFPSNGQVICADAFKYCKKADLDFDIIFADPPFHHKNTFTLPDIIFNNHSLKKDAWIIIEHSDSLDFSEHLNYIESRRYGNITFSFFKRSG